MKKFFSNISNILLVGVIAILLLQNHCSSKPRDTETITTIVTKYDTINTVTEIYTPIWDTRVIHSVDTITEYIDTTVVIQDYYTQYNYRDTVQIDSFGYVVINDTLFKNKLQSRQVSQNILIPITTITNTVFENKRELYVGIGAGMTTKGQLNQVSAELLFKTKRKQAYGIGVGLNNKLTPTITGRMYWKLDKR